MKTSAKGLALIKEFEGLRLAAYLCPANVWTIGYGHTSAAGQPAVYSGMRITEAQADEILRRDLAKYEAAVLRLVKVPLNQSQFDALASFCFNVGEGALGKSTLLRKLNRGEYGAVPSELMKWVRGGGRELPGLVRRRRAEAKLWRDLDARPAGPEEARVHPDQPVPDDVKPSESPSMWTILVTFLGGSGGLATLGGINNMFALIAFLAILCAGGVFAFLVLTGRVTFNRSP